MIIKFVNLLHICRMHFPFSKIVYVDIKQEIWT